MFGSHMIKTWSSTQNVIALSSGEAEYYGLVKAGAQSLGSKGMLKEMGVDAGIKLRTDASAAKGIATRRGWEKSDTLKSISCGCRIKSPEGSSK